MGAAGDMLAAALLELLPDRDEFVRLFNSIGIPGVTMAAEKSVKCGIVGTHVRILIDGNEEVAGDTLLHEHEHHHEHCHEHHHHDEDHEHEHCHEHEHHHDHGHHHEHHSLEDITAMVNGFRLSRRVKDDVLNVYRILAEAESRVHGEAVEDIHFHEVGSIDAVADITAVCVLMRGIAPDVIYCSPINTGSGRVKCAHGILPVPAPATAMLLRGIPSYQGNIRAELTTPTGAALLRYWVDEFRDAPCMVTRTIGYGMGSKDLEEANCVRSFFGELAEFHSAPTQTVSEDNAASAQAAREDMTGNDTDPDGMKTSVMTVLECNVDDMTAEEMSYALDKLFDAGAVDAWLTPIVMKKSRLATKVSALCHKRDIESVRTAMFRHTTTLGIRAAEVTRYELERDLSTAENELGNVRVKTSHGYGTMKSKAEFDDVAKIADENDMTIRDVRKTFI